MTSGPVILRSRWTGVKGGNWAGRRGGWSLEDNRRIRWIETVRNWASSLRRDLQLVAILRVVVDDVRRQSLLHFHFLALFHV